jgi:hypothetical protein
MKKVSAATIKSLSADVDPGNSDSIEVNLTKVVQAFILLQQARHNADYNLEAALDPADALAAVDMVNSAFVSWELTRSSGVAKNYFFALLFKERERM